MYDDVKIFQVFRDTLILLNITKKRFFSSSLEKREMSIGKNLNAFADSRNFFFYV